MAPSCESSNKVNAANLFTHLKQKPADGRGGVRAQFQDSDSDDESTNKKNPKPQSATNSWNIPGMDKESESIMQEQIRRQQEEDERFGLKKQAEDARIIAKEGGLEDDFDFDTVPQATPWTRESLEAKLGNGTAGLDELLKEPENELELSSGAKVKSVVHGSHPAKVASVPLASPWQDLMDDDDKIMDADLDDDEDDPSAINPETEGIKGSGPEDAAQTEEEEAEENRKMEVRLQIIALMQQMFAQDPSYKKKPLSVLNKEAVAFVKQGDDVGGIAAYAKVFRKIKEGNLTHPELYITHSNRAAAYLNLGLYEEALWDARQCQILAEKQFERNYERSAAPSYLKGFVRKGFAYMGLRRWRSAKAAFEEGIMYDPFNEDLKRGLEEATQGVLKDLIEGKSKEIRALPAPPKKERIGYLPYNAPLHRIHPKDMLPVRLLTPFQAENDYHVKDTYNYMTVQTDIRRPKRHFQYIEDNYYHDIWEKAMQIAVNRIQDEAKDVRVLNMGSGAGLLAMEVLRMGAHHVTCSERWLYLAMACKELLLSNGFSDDQVKVVYKRPSDLAIMRDVPIYCNLCVTDILDDGLLTSGIIPAFKHALANLLLPDAILMPASATVYMQAVEMRTKDVCGFDVSAINLHRWHPAYTSGRPFARDSYVPLSEPAQCWHFDFSMPPEESEQKTVELEFVRPGLCNAVLFWYDLRLIDDVYLSTGPESTKAGLKWLRPAMQYLPGELRVEEGMILPVMCAHNTVRMKFDIQKAEYMHLSKPDASFPRYQFNLLTDTVRNEAYYAAIRRVIAKRKAAGEEVHVIDLGAGSGILSMMCARAGADSVVAPELHEAMAQTARRNVAANGLSSKVSVVERDIGLLERGVEVRRKGCNMVVADFFDSGLLGDHFVYMLETAKRKVLTPNASMVPAAATVYCMGIEAYTTEVRGFDFNCMNKYRFDKTYETCYLDDVKHRRLTKPKKVFEYFFDGKRKGLSRENVLKLEVVSTGYMNAVVFWFDLHLDEEESLTSAPRGIGKGGVVEGELKREDTATVQASINESMARFKATLAANPRTELGAQLTQQELHLEAEYAAQLSAAGGERNSSMEAASDGAPQAQKEGSNQALGFMGADTFEGAREGYFFGMGCKGVGYYLDPTSEKHDELLNMARNAEVKSDFELPQHKGSDLALGFIPAATFGGPRMGYFFANGCKGTGYYLDPLHSKYKDMLKAVTFLYAGTANQEPAESARLERVVTFQEPEPTGNTDNSVNGQSETGRVSNQIINHTSKDGGNMEEDGANDEDEQPRHHWGQALQYLERATQVTAGKKVTVLAKREGHRIHFTLREGAGNWVGKAPWLIEWGGGASVESPHYQRVHYCQLLVNDFMMRLRCKRFPPIEKDMKMILAHCGSLFLDPAILCEVYHNFVVLEITHGTPEFCPGASMEAMTKEPLELA